MSRPENKPSWLNTLVLLGAAAFFIWLAHPLFKDRGERQASDTGPPGYFHLYPGERKIQLSTAFVQAKSVASARHVSPVEIRSLLNQLSQEHDRIDAETLNKALDESWPMK